MNARSADGRPNLRALAHRGLIADPRRQALAVQMLVALETVWMAVLWVAGGEKSVFYAQTSLVTDVVVIAPGVLFLVWFSLVRKNAEAFAPGMHRHSPRFAIYGWLIPVAWWWIPRQVTLDIWRASGLAGNTRLVEAWWLAWLVNTFGSSLVMLLTGDADLYGLFDQVANLAAAILVILVIRRITAAQYEWYRQDVAAASDRTDLPAF
ncbi:DUF4328 domain-containing protein [Kitasatospora sp. HPMI-4]|uniref:DUF4328 domain-containing protein n=1 Tax=Kitasatospora sp. HPMI-4 TaxID=3448443 RepID=UPI003F19D16A